MRRRRALLRIAGTMCFAAAGLVLVTPSPGGADAPIEVSWWQRATPVSSDERVEGQSRGAAVLADLDTSAAEPSQEVPDTTLPPPPTTLPPPAPLPTVPPLVTIPEGGQNPPTPVPSGGLYVANASTGPTGMSALRFPADGVGTAQLTLRIAPGSTPVGDVRACPALSGWLPAENGVWSARPAHDCERVSVTGLIAEDGATISWGLEGFIVDDSDTLDVLLLPLEGDGNVFSIAFEAPGNDSLEVLSPPPPSTTAPTLPPLDEDLLPPPASELPDDGFAPPDTSADSGGSDGGGLLPSPSAVLEPFTESRTARIVSTVLLVAMGIAFYLASNNKGRVPQLIGALASGGSAAVEPGARSRGIGRFARPRSEPPPRL